MKEAFEELLEDLIQNALAQGMTLSEIWTTLQMTMNDLPRHRDLQRADTDA